MAPTYSGLLCEVEIILDVKTSLVNKMQTFPLRANTFVVIEVVKSFDLINQKRSGGRPLLKI